MRMDKKQLRRAIALIREVSRHAKRMYVGRSNFPERRLLQHMANAGRNKLFAVYWTDDAEEAKAVEELLINEFEHLARVENRVSDGRGRVGAPPHAVYVSWVWKPGVSQTEEIGGLTAKIVNEMPGAPGRSRYLRTELDRYRAEDALGSAH